MTDEAAPVGRVVSASDDATVLIEKLREIARGVAALGNDVTAAESSAAKKIAEAEDLGLHASDLMSEAEEALKVMALWRDSLADFRRGLLDKDELFERTIDREPQ